MGEHKNQRMSLQQLSPYISKQNLPIDEMRTRLWKNIIEQEFKNGKSIEDFMQYITKKNFPTIIDPDTGNQTNYLEEMWKWLIWESYLKERNFEKLELFITPQNFADSDTRESIWMKLILAELKRLDMYYMEDYARAHLTGWRKQKALSYLADRLRDDT
jgi:hypothetical protein